MKDIKVGAWCALLNPYRDEKHIREMAQCGIDFIFDGFDGEENDAEVLRLCEENKIGIFMDDDVSHGEINAESFRNTAKKLGYLDSPAFIGHNLCDEPGAGAYDDLGERAAEYKKAFPDKIPYVNLLPSYAPIEVCSTESYREYYSKFADKVSKEYISVDIYPFNEIDGKKGTFDGYLENIAACADVARKNGGDFYGFIQTMGFNHIMREPSEWEMRWQVYCYLAFGANRIMHFCYMTPSSSVEFFERAMIGKDGEKTHLWHYGKAVNDELHALSPLLSGYDNLGAFIVRGGEKSHGIEFADPIEESALVGAKNLKADENVLIGVYKKGEKYAFVALNVSEVGRGVDAHLSFETESDIRVFTKDGIVTKQAGSQELTLGAAVVFVD